VPGTLRSQAGDAEGGLDQNASNVANAYGICVPRMGPAASLGAVAGVAELLAVPGLEVAAPEEPVIADALVGVPVGQRLVEPVVGLEDVVMRPAVDDAVCVIIVVEVDDVIGDEVHGAVELSEGSVEERLHSLTARAVAAVGHVLGEQGRDGVEILAVDSERVPLRQLADPVTGDELFDGVHGLS
jgi:hypothetical protein